MPESREQWLAETFVELSDTLVADFDLIDFLHVLVERCSQLLSWRSASARRRTGHAPEPGPRRRSGCTS